MPSRKVVRRRAEAIRRAVLECLEERQLLAYAPVTVSVEAFDANLSEATASQGGYFQIRAAADMCSSDPPPPSVTVVFQLSGTATKNTDYGNSALLAESVTFSINQQTGVGSANLAFFAKDDPITMEVEDTETVVVTLKDNSAYTVDEWYRSAEGTIEDDDVNLAVDAPALTALTSNYIPVHVTGYGGSPRSGVTVEVLNWDDDILTPLETEVVSDWDGTALIPIDVWADGNSPFLVMAAGKQANQQVAADKVTIKVDNVAPAQWTGSVWSGGKFSPSVRVTDPNNNNAPLEGLGVDIIPGPIGGPTKFMLEPVGTVNTDNDGTSNLTVRTHSVQNGQQPLEITVCNLAAPLGKQIQKATINVTVKQVKWVVSLPDGNQYSVSGANNLPQQIRYRVEAQDPNNAQNKIEGLSVLFSIDAPHVAVLLDGDVLNKLKETDANGIAEVVLTTNPLTQGLPFNNIKLVFNAGNYRNTNDGANDPTFSVLA